MAICFDKERHLKFYKDWLERVRGQGNRDPENPFKMLPVSHPLTQKTIKRLETEICLLEGKCSLEEYYKRMEETSK